MSKTDCKFCNNQGYVIGFRGDHECPYFCAARKRRMSIQRAQRIGSMIGLVLRALIALGIVGVGIYLLARR